MFFFISIELSDFARTLKGKIPLSCLLSVPVNGSRGRTEQQDPGLKMLPME